MFIPKEGATGGVQGAWILKLNSDHQKLLHCNFKFREHSPSYFWSLVTPTLQKQNQTLCLIFSCCKDHVHNSVVINDRCSIGTIMVAMDELVSITEKWLNYKNIRPKVNMSVANFLLLLKSLETLKTSPSRLSTA